jgi:hypothetical protein
MPNYPQDKSRLAYKGVEPCGDAQDLWFGHSRPTQKENSFLEVNVVVFYDNVIGVFMTKDWDSLLFPFLSDRCTHYMWANLVQIERRTR